MLQVVAVTLTVVVNVEVVVTLLLKAIVAEIA